MVRILSLGLIVLLYSLLFVNPILATCHGAGPISLGCQPAGLTQIEAVFSRVIQVSVGLAFVVLVVMLVIGGIRFLTSGGEKNALQAASGTITWAILGILFLAIAWLVLLLIETFTGIRLTQFDVRSLCTTLVGVPGLCP